LGGHTHAFSQEGGPRFAICSQLRVDLLPLSLWNATRLRRYWWVGLQYSGLLPRIDIRGVHHFLDFIVFLLNQIFSESPRFLKRSVEIIDIIFDF
jgi:hypothetical protein